MAEEIPIDLVMRARDEMTNVLDDVIKSSGGVEDALGDVAKSTDKASSETDGFSKSARESAKESDNLSDKMKGIGTAAKAVATAVAGAAAAAGAAIAAIGAAAIKTISDTNAWAGTLDGLGDVLGTNANESAALAVAIRGVGGDVGAVTGQMVKLTKGLEDNNGKASETAKLMTSLGISYKDANGKMLPASAIIENTANAIAKMPDGLEKTNVMTQIFGRSGKDLGDTMAALANGGLDNAMKKAKEFGLAVGDDGVNASIEFGKKSAELQMRMEGMSVTIGNALLPAIMPFMDTLNDLSAEYLPQVSAAMIPVIQSFIAFAKDNLPAIIESLKLVIDWVTTNWPTIRDTVVNVFNAIVKGYDEYVKPVVDFFIEAFTSMSYSTSENMDIIGQKIDSIMQGIKNIVEPILTAVQGFWKDNGESISGFVMEYWTSIKEIISGVMLIITTAIDTALPAIQATIEKYLPTIQFIFETAWGAIQIIVGTALDLVKGIINTVLALINGDTEGALGAIQKTFNDIWTRISGVIQKWIDTAREYIDSELARSGTSIEKILGDINGYFTEKWTAIYNTVEYWINTIKNLGATVWQQFRDDTIARFNEIKEAIISTIRTAAQYWNTIAPFMGWTPIVIPQGRTSASRTTNDSSSGARANVVVNVYGGDAATAERGVVSGLQRAGFAILR